MTADQASRSPAPASIPPAVAIPGEDFEAAMTRLTAGLSGPVGVAIRDLTGERTLEWNADEPFPTASTLKVPLLYETYRQAEAGRIDLAERLTLRHDDRVPGSGVLQHLDDGIGPTVRDLAELMIIVSDNWATDILFERLGRDRIAAMLAEAGMTGTYLPMTIRELFISLVGGDPADPALTYDELRRRLKDNEPTADSAGVALDSRNDISTPADMVRLLAHISEGTGISAASRDAILATLRHQNFTSIIPFRLPTDRKIEVAHKTGSLKGVRNDVGIVTAPGVSYAIALMSRGQDDIPEVYDRLSRISRWAWDTLSVEAS
ncbi:MAG TPA: serine hydrolase [Thermomicrobiales bacterium]|jgi:beta-lactamase class A|nr:serine hydrolase [Thermomicrobiales bacterium]